MRYKILLNLPGFKKLLRNALYAVAQQQKGILAVYRLILSGGPFE